MATPRKTQPSLKKEEETGEKSAIPAKFSRIGAVLKWQFSNQSCCGLIEKIAKDRNDPTVAEIQHNWPYGTLLLYIRWTKWTEVQSPNQTAHQPLPPFSFSILFSFFFLFVFMQAQNRQPTNHSYQLIFFHYLVIKYGPINRQ